MNLTIIPYYCGLPTTNCYGQDEKVTIYNKVRQNFQLKVGSGLSLINLIFDSLDSIMSE
jgi:hypothetical protein